MTQQIREIEELCKSNDPLMQYYQNEIRSDLKELYAAVEVGLNQLPTLKNGDIVVEHVGDMGNAIPVLQTRGYTVMMSIASMQEVIEQNGYVDPFAS